MTPPISRLLIAEIGNAHGIRGLVKLRVYCDDLDLINGQDLFTHETGDATLKITLDHVTDNLILARIGNTQDRTAAEKLRGLKLYINRDTLPETEENEYYHTDLIGLGVRNSNSQLIGTVQAMANFGASDLIDVKPPTGSSFYIPFTDDFIVKTDLTARVITVQHYEGFIPDPPKEKKKQ